jgi:hypothetical protein
LAELLLSETEVIIVYAFKVLVFYLLLAASFKMISRHLQSFVVDGKTI